MSAHDSTAVRFQSASGRLLPPVCRLLFTQPSSAPAGREFKTQPGLDLHGRGRVTCVRDQGQVRLVNTRGELCGFGLCSVAQAFLLRRAPGSLRDAQEPGWDCALERLAQQ